MNEMQVREGAPIATNLLKGCIYKNAQNDNPMRLVDFVPCQGVMMEAADGSGYGETIPFKDVLYASMDEVQDFLEDLEVFNNNTLVKD
jgi:hypothetical protein